jgi:hypothetical protein
MKVTETYLNGHLTESEGFDTYLLKFLKNKNLYCISNKTFEYWEINAISTEVFLY